MNCKNHLKLYLLLFIIFGSPLSYSGPTGNVDFKVLESHHSASLDLGKKCIIINDEETFVSELDNFKRVEHDFEVDFLTHSVAIITMGVQGSGGYSLNLESVIDDGVNVTITYNSITPGSGCCAISVLTNPYIIIEVDTQKNIIFKERTFKQDYSYEKKAFVNILLQ